ncbi:aminopeptidase N [Klugiella xanthotipulae]|uniref:Aminopeptidase N n=1 Tax=Klugiella xanthotipulae TaxID=244735 RepID=A0A543HSW7_9MICO|nr:aminopeptidase N [Klugiella xanthotipulae]TQM61438.1 aminopeptidase N [Klugiella xanthotipulae]
MPGENLTRNEAQERAALVSVSSYEVTLDLTQGAKTFRSATTVRFTAIEGASTFIDAITRAVHSVTLNGRELDPGTVNDGVRIQLNNLAASNELHIVADAEYTNTGEGLHRFVDPVDGEVYLYSQFEVPDSRRMFAVFEQPDLKATFQFTITAPETWKVVSNSPTPEPSPTGDGVATWAFAPTPVLSSYITALIAGPYVEVRSELTSRDGRTIPLGLFCRASLADYLDSDSIFDITRRGFAFFEEKFGYPYPFEKYDQLFVPEFNAGAMENAGAVTFTETYVFRSKVTDAVRERRVVTILHELAHMWFGDLVTMRWWNDLWLNESFAEYASTLATAEATEWTEAWTTFASLEKSWAYRQDQLPSTHPIVATINDLEDVQVNFDGITYAKGASVLKQLVAWVGQDDFLTGVHNYFVKHAYGNTELTDLLSELEATSGRDLGSWSRLWLETAGVNTLRPVIETDAAGIITRFAVHQSAHQDYPTLRPHRLAIAFYGEHDGALVRQHRVELDINGAITEVPELVGHPRPPLVIVNDDDLAYAKVRLDEHSAATARASLVRVGDPLARALAWSSLWDATRDAETRPRDFIDLAITHIGTETASTTLRTVLNQLLLATSHYVDPATRMETRARVGDALWQLAQNAQAGSDAQFQFVKAFTQVAHTEKQLSIVAALLDESIDLVGLDIDTDLGWELLIALAAGGRVSAAEIDAALQDDNTASGAQSAAHARAALPTPADKRAAWDSVITSTGASNTIVRATGLGFSQVNDPTVLEAFIEPYFECLTRIWESRSYSISSTIVVDFFPNQLASQRLVDATLAWLDTHPDIPALRRLVIENLAGVQRALTAQDADRK